VCVQDPQHAGTRGVPQSTPLHVPHGASGSARLIPGNHGTRRLPGGHQVVWNWQAVAVVRSDPVRDQENHPAWPLGRPVAWSLKSGS
jgi:hypothetical protein